MTSGLFRRSLIVTDEEADVRVAKEQSFLLSDSIVSVDKGVCD